MMGELVKKSLFFVPWGQRSVFFFIIKIAPPGCPKTVTEKTRGPGPWNEHLRCSLRLIERVTVTSKGWYTRIRNFNVVLRFFDWLPSLINAIRLVLVIAVFWKIAKLKPQSQRPIRLHLLGLSTNQKNVRLRWNYKSRAYGGCKKKTKKAMITYCECVHFLVNFERKKRYACFT